jgi:hypothetical protein
LLPRGRNALTRTTTRTFPPGASILPTGVTLPSLERSDGVEAVDLADCISTATPGISRESRAIPINVSLISRIASWNLCCRWRYMGLDLGYFSVPPPPKYLDRPMLTFYYAPPALAG